VVGITSLVDTDAPNAARGRALAWVPTRGRASPLGLARNLSTATVLSSIDVARLSAAGPSNLDGAYIVIRPRHRTVAPR